MESLQKKAKPKPKLKLKKVEAVVKKPLLKAKIKTGEEEGKFRRIKSVFESGESSCARGGL